MSSTSNRGEHSILPLSMRWRAKRSSHRGPIAVRLHAGYGWDDLPAYERYLCRPICRRRNHPASVDRSARREYDSQEFNVGMRLHLFSKLHLVLALWKLQEFTSSVMFSFVL
jgi:hypothetical protein